MWNYGHDEHQKALDLLRRATELDPMFSTAHAYLCYAYYEGVVMGWPDDPVRDLELGMDAGRQAIWIDSMDPVGHFAVGRIHMMQGNHDASIASLRKAIELNPSFSQAHHGLSMVLTLAGDLEEARAAGLEVERLSPRDPILWATTIVQALSYVLEEKPEAALEWVRKTEQLHRSTGYWVPAISAAALAQSGRLEEARKALEAARRELPKLSLNYLVEALPTRQPDGLKPYLDALRTAGLPE